MNSELMQNLTLVSLAHFLDGGSAVCYGVANFLSLYVIVQRRSDCQLLITSLVNLLNPIQGGVEARDLDKAVIAKVLTWTSIGQPCVMARSCLFCNLIDSSNDQLPGTRGCQGPVESILLHMQLHGNRRGKRGLQQDGQISLDLRCRLWDAMLWRPRCAFRKIPIRS